MIGASHERRSRRKKTAPGTETNDASILIESAGRVNREACDLHGSFDYVFASDDPPEAIALLDYFDSPPPGVRSSGK